MSEPRIAILGAGAIGTYLTGLLALAGLPVTLIARPSALPALQADGIHIEEGGHTRHTRDFTAARAEAVRGPVDVLLLATKSQQLGEAVAQAAHLLGPRTLVACLQNGIPWWYFHGAAGPWEGRHLQALDPRGAIAAALPLERVLGCVIYKSADLLAPGRVAAARAAGDRLVFGSPGGQRPPGLETLLAALERAGVVAPFSSTIRHDLWDKLLGNAAFNPLSALTRADMGRIIAHPLTGPLVLEVMREVGAVAAAHGIALANTPEQRLERSRAVGPVRSSMLQDTQRGRPLEVAGILGTLLELAQLARVSAPRLETLHAAATLLSATLGEEHPPSTP